LTKRRQEQQSFIFRILSQQEFSTV